MPKTIAPRKIKPGSGVKEFSPTEEILNGKMIRKAIVECLENNDREGVMEVFSIYMNTAQRTIKHLESLIHKK